jgi:hypothetical protein
LNEIPKRSQILTELIKAGQIILLGAMYNVETGTVKFYENSIMAADNFVPSNRAEHTILSQMAYLSLQAKAGKAVVVRFEVDPKSRASIKRVVLNGFEINTPDIRKQARMPIPQDGDEHVDTGNKVMLSWSPAPNAASHDVYFGTDKAAVAAAEHASECRSRQRWFYQP